jgi:L-aspartate oxidase
VVPAAHYTCGGVFADEEGTTNVARLSAVGEVACTGLHGANRLASTSLLEGLVCGTLVAQKIARNVARSQYHFPEVEPWIQGTEEEDPALIAQDWSLIQQTMWNYVGLVRTRRRLLRAQMLLAELGNEIERFYKDSRLTDGLIGLRNASLVSQLVVKAAIQNKVSRGCHFRLD